jgi:hypothetical protein
MKNLRTIGLIGLLVSLSTLAACALFQKKADATIADIDSCIGSNEAQDVKDLKHAAGQFILQVLTCDAEGGLSPAQLAADLPLCAEAAIPGVEASLGPDGKEFVDCALNKIRNDPNALVVQKNRAKKLQAKRSP